MCANTVAMLCLLYPKSLCFAIQTGNRRQFQSVLLKRGRRGCKSLMSFASLALMHLRAAVLTDVLGIVADQAVALAGDAGLQLAGRRQLEALLHACTWSSVWAFHVGSVKVPSSRSY